MSGILDFTNVVIRDPEWTKLDTVQQLLAVGAVLLAIEAIADEAGWCDPELPPGGILWAFSRYAAFRRLIRAWERRNTLH